MAVFGRLTLRPIWCWAIVAANGSIVAEENVSFVKKIDATRYCVKTGNGGFGDGLSWQTDPGDKEFAAATPVSHPGIDHVAVTSGGLCLTWEFQVTMPAGASAGFHFMAISARA